MTLRSRLRALFKPAPVATRLEVTVDGPTLAKAIREARFAEPPAVYELICRTNGRTDTYLVRDVIVGREYPFMREQTAREAFELISSGDRRFSWVTERDARGFYGMEVPI